MEIEEKCRVRNASCEWEKELSIKLTAIVMESLTTIDIDDDDDEDEQRNMLKSRIV